jgi:hypothetical protein
LKFGDRCLVFGACLLFGACYSMLAAPGLQAG